MDCDRLLSNSIQSYLSKTKGIHFMVREVPGVDTMCEHPCYDSVVL